MNPLLLPSPLEFGFPDFDAIREEHFAEAFKVAMAEQRAEVAAITALPGAPTFDDTVVALERSGSTLRRVSAVFFVLAMVLLKQTVAGALAISVLMLAFYVPLGYHVDRFMWRRRMAKQRAAREAGANHN